MKKGLSENIFRPDVNRRVKWEKRPEGGIRREGRGKSGITASKRGIMGDFGGGKSGGG
jgi:hypothetical protein